MAERRKLSDIIFNRDTTVYNNEQKRYNFFRDDDTLYNNTNFIQGWNTGAGKFDVSTMGNGASNSAVVACLQVLGVSFSEAVLQVKVFEDQLEKIVPDHPLTLLMRRPNPYMSGDILQQYIINAMHVSGDAYIIKQKNNANQLVALYPLMPEQVTPKGNNQELITHYEYETQNKKVMIMPEDMVHIRLGLDQTDHKKGFAPLRSVLREIYGDESAGQMATALLANSGVPSVMISPKDDFGPTKEEAEQIAKTYQQKVSGKNKGMPLILSGSMEIKKMAFSPTELDIGTLRRVPEERISAVLGVPAILAGLGAGLERATYSNAKELREFFTENKLIPLWKQVGEELTQQILLKDYETNKMTRSEYNFSEVRALQTDVADVYNRVNVGVQGGWITIAEARESVGLPVNDQQKVYLLDQSKMLVPENKINTETSTEETSNEVSYDGPEIITEDDKEEKAEFKVIKEIDDEFCVISKTGKNMGCYPTRKLAEARLRQIERYSDNSKSAEDEDIFDNPAEAMNRSKELSCAIGVHTHKLDDGKTVFMPCKSHEEYEKAIGKDD